MNDTSVEARPTADQIKKDMQGVYDPIGQWMLQDAEKGDKMILTRTQPARYWMEHKLDTTFRLGRFSKTDHLLEIGCTAGHYTFMLAEQGYHVTGTDISAESIKAAQAVGRRAGLNLAEFLQADAEDMREIADDTFGGAFSFSTLRYVPNPVRAMREIRRVLKPGGRAVVDFPNKYCPWFEFLKFLAGGERHIHDHTYSAGEVRKMMQEAGFVNVESKTIIFFAKTFPGALTPLYKGADWLFERTPGLNYFAGIVMCKGEKAAA